MSLRSIIKIILPNVKRSTVEKSRPTITTITKAKTLTKKGKVAAVVLYVEIFFIRYALIALFTSGSNVCIVLINNACLLSFSKHLWKWVFSQDNPEWKQWDAPYFEHHSLPYDEFREKAENWVQLSYQIFKVVLANIDTITD
ncbi:hypothetical protein [Shouchella clausii]|uniref:hypothetical protein n=1 Tax=Shouchella clausii TaxID=79880 RepID=UPI000B95F054|nr:hypothetical protein [Shouchella clausii]MCR1290098.1 hypothetical protein [Shouchella clausii]MEB5475226.1 hypothetical protein [Shouchella clausii]QNM44114.1 hypothetical protein DUT88_14930 [Shouchella clausii]WQG97199.1 hypothetical protein SR921_10905 [Shouchella clausii]